MTTEAEWRRNSPAMFAVRAAEHATTVVPTFFVWLSIRSKWPVWLGVRIDLIFALVGGIVILSLLADWWITRFAVTADGMRFEQGLLLRRSTFLAWPDVVSVQVSRSAVGRALGCSRIAIGVGTESKAQMVIEAVSVSLATEIEDRYTAGRHRVPPQPFRPLVDGTTAEPMVVIPPDIGEKPLQNVGDLIYRIHWRDYFMLSITYGQFILIIPFGFGLYENAAGLSWLPAILPTDGDLVASPALLAVIALLLAVPAAIGFGVAVAWLRYRAFEVRLEGAMFVMTGGLVSAESRQVSRSQVAGIKIQQNPLMRVTGYARLAFVSRQSGERIGANVIFPAVRQEFLRTGIQRYFSSYAKVFESSQRADRRLFVGLATVDAAVLAGAGVVLTDQSWARMVSVLSVLAIGLLVMNNYCWASAEIDPENAVIGFRRGFLWVTHYIVPCESVYFIYSQRVSFLERASLGFVCLGVYDSRAIRLRVPLGSHLLLDQFIETAWMGIGRTGRFRRMRAMPAATSNPLGDFLRASRARLDPDEIGVVSAGGRRVAGLRREEVAVLAGVSADYYARLEQGRERNPSAQVIDAIGRALRLTPDARGHVFRLAGLNPRQERDAFRATVHPALLQVLESFPTAAAYVLGPTFDVLAANPIATALLSPFEGTRNMVRILFHDPAARVVFAEWDLVVRATVHALRLNAGLYPDDTEIRSLIEEMLASSDDFRGVWDDQSVHALTRAYKVFVHPQVGRVELTYQTFDVHDAPGQQLLVGTATLGSSSADALAILGSLHAP